MKIVDTTKAPKAIGPYVQAIQNGDLLFTSGQIALKPNGDFIDGDIATQAKQVFANLIAILEKGNSSISKVIKTTIFLVDMGDFEEVNEIYGEFFKEHKPARSTIAVRALPKNALIEIEAIATVN